MSAHRLWMKSGASGRAIDFQHTAIDKDENDDAHDLHRKADEQGLHEQPQQGAQLHGFKRGLQRCQHIRGDVGGALDNASGSGNHALGQIEHGVYYVECVGEDEDGRRRFEYPLEEHPCINVMEVIPVYEHLDQLIGCYKG